MINMGRPKYWIHRSATHFATVSAVLSRIGIHNWCKVPQHTMVQKTILELSGDSISKKVHTKCFVDEKGPQQRCWKSGFWRMPFCCTCWTLELSSHVVENLWSGTTETKSPQKFLLARVSTIVMDILNDFFLVRRQWFLNNCSTVATIFIVRGRFVRQVRAALSLPEKNTPRSRLSGQTAIVSLDVSLASGL